MHECILISPNESMLQRDRELENNLRNSHRCFSFLIITNITGKTSLSWLHVTLLLLKNKSQWNVKEMNGPSSPGYFLIIVIAGNS